MQHQPRAGVTELRITFATSTEHFENWLYFLLRDAGAHIETTDPAAIARALGLAPNDPGVVAVNG